jgi:hypothetical protein
MKEVKDLTIDDLRAEGRRWVLYPGETDTNGVRADVVFEDHPYRFAVGLISNDPSIRPPIYLCGDDPEKTAIEWCVRHLDDIRDQMDWHMVVASSIRAQVLCSKVHVGRDPDTDECRLCDGYGHELSLSGENAECLYQDLARAYHLPFRKSCPKCGHMFDEDDQCEWCDEAE